MANDNSSVIQLVMSILGAEAVTGSLEGINESVGGLGEKMLELASVTAVIDKSIDLFKETIGEGMTKVGEMADEIVRNNAVLGISSDAYQAFAVTLQAAHQDMSSFIPAMSIMNKTIGEAAMGSADAAKKLAGIGLSYQQLKGLAPERQFEAVARAIAEVADPNVRAAMAAELLGRSYANLRPLIDQLAHGGLDNLNKSLKESSLILGGEYVTALSEASVQTEEIAKRTAVALAPMELYWKNITNASKGWLATLVQGANLQGPADVTRGFEAMADKIIAARNAAKSLGEIFAADAAAYKLQAEIQKSLKPDDKGTAVERERNSTSGRLTTAMAVSQEKILADAKLAVVKAEGEEEQQWEKEWDAGEKARSKTRSEVSQTEYDLKKHLADSMAKIQKEVAAQEKKNNSEAAQDERIAFETALLEIRKNGYKIEYDFTKTDAEKWASKKQNLADEATAIQLNIDELKAKKLLEAPGSEAAKAIKNDILADDKKLDAVNQKSAELPNPNSFVEQWQRAATSIRQSYGTMAQGIASAMTTIVGGMSNGLNSSIQGLINRTMTWRDAFKNLASSISASMVKAFADVATSWIMNHTVMALVDKVFTTQHVATVAVRTEADVGGTGIAVAAHVTGEQLKTASTLEGSAIRMATWVKEAIASVYKGAIAAFDALASIPYVGPILGVAAMVAAVAGGMALVGKMGFSEGGHTGSAPATEVAGVVHGGEWVAPEWMLKDKRYSGTIASLEAVRQGKSGSADNGEYSWGGFVSSGLGRFMGSGGLGFTEFTKQGKNFSDKYNLFTGSKLYGSSSAGGAIVKPTAAQLGIDGTSGGGSYSYAAPSISAQMASGSTGAGGTTGAAASKQQGRPIYIMFSEDQMRAKILNNGDFDAAVVNAMKSNQHLVYA